MKNRSKIIALLLSAAALLASCASMDQGMDDEMTAIALYSVQDGKLTPHTEEGETYLQADEVNRGRHEYVWNTAMNIIPDSYEPYIHNFRISSDGEENIMAYVEPKMTDEETDLSSWTLAVDLIDAMDRQGALKTEELNETLIHEFGHILSFNSTQTIAVPPEELEDEYWADSWDFSKTYRSWEAITLEESYLNQFFQKFWGEEQLREWFDRENGITTEEEYYTAYNEMSIKYYTDFVSDYAMTNPDEDFAESFTQFVLQDKPEGETVSVQKILFFYDFPEMMEIREEIRSALPDKETDQ